MKSFILSVVSSLILFAASCSEPARTGGSSNQPVPAETARPKASISPAGENPPTVTDAGKVDSISVEARYKNYFDRDSKCRKSYDELFGNADGYYNEGSACTGRISVDRDGAATKTVELNRYDKDTRQMKTVEKSVWTARIGGDKFKTFAEAVTGDDFIKNYPEGMQIYTSNFNVSVSQEGRTKTFAGNADDKNPQPISIIDLFKKLDGETEWTKNE